MNESEFDDIDLSDLNLQDETIESQDEVKIILAHETVIDRYIKQRIFDKIGINTQTTSQVKAELKKFAHNWIKDILNDLGDQLADILLITQRSQIDLPILTKAYKFFEAVQVMTILRNLSRIEPPQL